MKRIDNVNARLVYNYLLCLLAERSVYSIRDSDLKSDSAVQIRPLMNDRRMVISRIQRCFRRVRIFAVSNGIPR